MSTNSKVGAVHHYVPQSYLRKFSIDGKPNHIYAYELGKEPYATNVRNVAGQTDFYTYTDPENNENVAEIEEALSGIDELGIQAINSLHNAELGEIELESEKREALLTYIAFLYTRNLRSRKRFSKSFEKSATTLMQIQATNREQFHKDAKAAHGEGYDYDKAESARKALVDEDITIKYNSNHQYFMGMALKHSKDLYRVLDGFKKVLLVGTKSSPSRHFITSDNPVSRYAPEGFDSSRGLGHIHAIFQLPISPTRCLLLVNKDMQLSNERCSRTNVEHMNWYTCYFADRWVFSHVKSKSISSMFNQHSSQESGPVIDSPFSSNEEEE